MSRLASPDLQIFLSDRIHFFFVLARQLTPVDESSFLDDDLGFFFSSRDFQNVSYQFKSEALGVTS